MSEFIFVITSLHNFLDIYFRLHRYRARRLPRRLLVLDHRSIVTAFNNGGCGDFPPVCSDCPVTLWSVNGGESTCGFYWHQKFIHT